VTGPDDRPPVESEEPTGPDDLTDSTAAIRESEPDPTTDGAIAEGAAPAAGRRGTAAAHAASRARRIGGRPSPVPAAPPADRPRPTPKPVPAAAAEEEPKSRPVPKRKITAPSESEPVRTRQPLRAWLPIAILAVALVAVVVVDLTWLGGLKHPGGHQSTSSAADRQKLLAQAKTKVAKVASYDYRHIDADAKAAEAGTTGDFTATYDKSIQTVIKPLAAQVEAIVSCSIQTAGITSVSGDGKQAVVLVYAQLATQNSTTNGQSRLDIATIQATMTKRGSDWYISKLDRE
jgi:hypothetical protein